MRCGHLDGALLRDVVERQYEVLVVRRNPGAIRGRDPVEAEHGAVACQLLGRADAVGRQTPPFDLAALVGERDKRLPVRQEAGLPVADAGASGDLDETALQDGCDENLTAGGQRDAIASGREMRCAEVVHRFVDPAFAKLVEVGGERDRHGAVVIRPDVVEVDVRSELVDDPTGVQGRGLHVQSHVVRVLLEVGPALVHGPEVHRAVAVACEVHPALPPHRVLAGTGEVGGQRDRLGASLDERPDVLGCSSTVPLRVAALERKPREEQRLAVRVVATIAGLRQREKPMSPAADVERDQLLTRQRGVVARRVEHPAVRGPARDQGIAALPRPAGREAACQGHGEDLGRAFIRSRECDHRPIRGDCGMALLSRVCRQPLCRSARCCDHPEVALGGEDDHILVDGREPVVAPGRPGLREQGHGHERKHEEKHASHRVPSTSPTIPRPG